MLFLAQALVPAIVFEALVYFLLALVFSIVSFAKKTVSIRGIVFGNTIGLLVFLLGGINSFFALALFYAAGETATIFVRKRTGTKHEKRTSFNIAGNVFSGVLFLFLGQIPAFFGSISAALSDTLSSEIGLLSKTKPRLITTLKEVEHGTNGGITLLGVLMVLTGATIVSGTYFLLYSKPLTAFFVFAAGITGSTIDSFLGALLENRKIIGKATVNFFATLFGALTVLALQVLTAGA